MIQIHLYEKGDFTFPNFPVNSYETEDIDNVIATLRDLLNNHNSGISKIVIENNEFGCNESVAELKYIMKI